MYRVEARSWALNSSFFWLSTHEPVYCAAGYLVNDDLSINHHVIRLIDSLINETPSEVVLFKI